MKQKIDEISSKGNEKTNNPSTIEVRSMKTTNLCGSLGFAYIILLFSSTWLFQYFMTPTPSNEGNQYCQI